MAEIVPLYTREQVRAEAKRQFGKDSVTGSMLLLDQYDVEPNQSGRERVQMAILKLSNGQVSDVRHDVKQAQDDFRDVLSWAECHGK